MPSIETSKSGDRLLHEFLCRGNDGQRDAVPVLGSGINIEAAAIEGLTNHDDWRQLIEKIGTRVRLGAKEIDRLPRSNIARWESLLRNWSERKRVFPFEAEIELQKFVCEELRRQEKKSRHYSLYKEFAGAGWRDIISLNFDRRIAMAAPKEEFVSGPQRPKEGPQGESLYRHSQIPTHGGRWTRVWYPHGDTRKCSTIKLGIRKYGFFISTLVEHLFDAGDDWRHKKPWYWEGTDTKADVAYDSWTNVILSRPLVFIGCGLSSDEWTIWWLLQQRASNRTAKTSGAPSVLFLTAARPSNQHQFELIPGMRIVQFRNYSEMWRGIRNAIGS